MPTRKPNNNRARMLKKNKLVYGVGQNDADYPVYIYSAIDGGWKVTWRCPVYRVWASMLSRSYSAKFQDRSPAYADCSVAPEWHSFSVFRAWMLTQPWEGSQLDKDILQPGNKIYGAETCVFVSHQLNAFLTDSGASRGEWPIGVSWQKRADKFHAYCNNPFTSKKEHLGFFARPDAAHEAWRRRKHELACQYADMQTDPRIAASLRNRYAGEAK